MAPIKKLKTYGRSNKSTVINSVDAVNILFAKNKAKARQNRKKKLLIKELSPRPRGQTLLTDDSIHVSMEDTFDKVVKGKVYNKVNAKPQINISSSNASKSIRQVNTYYSPIMTRRKKKIALIGEASSEISKSNETNSRSIIPHFLDPTVDKIDCSLEIEKIPKPTTSLSYIKLPERENVFNSLLKPNDTSTSRKEMSYDPIFSKTFLEKQMIHSSTPLIPMKRNEKIINYTISPIQNLAVPEGSVNRISRRKSTRTRVNTDKQNISLLPDDWKLQTNPEVLVSHCPQIHVTCEGFPSADKIQSQSHQLSSHEIHENTDSPEAVNTNNNLPKKFVTLRRGRSNRENLGEKKRRSGNKNYVSKNLNISDEVAKVPSEASNTNLTWSLEDFNSFVEKASGSNNLTWSLEDFEAFVDKVQSDRQKSETNPSQKTHQLSEFESFVTKNKHLLGSSEPLVNMQKNKISITETPIQFVTRRRRRISDSCLVSAKKPRNSKGKLKIKRSKRRLSLQESTRPEYPDLSLKEMVVMLSIIDIDKEMKTDLPQSKKTNVELCDNSQNAPPCTSNKFIGNTLSNVTGDSDAQELSLSKQLVVNLTRMPVDLSSVENQTSNVYSLLEESNSLFDHSGIINSENHTNNIHAKQILTQDTDISVEKNCDVEIAANAINKPRVSKHVLEEKRSLSVNAPTSSIQEKSAGTILEDSCTYSESVGNHLSSEPIVTEAAKSPEKSLRRTTNIPACDFENFFINMTKRTKSPKSRPHRRKSSASRDQLLEISDNSKEIDHTAETSDKETGEEPRIKAKSSTRTNETEDFSAVIAEKSCKFENSFKNITKRSRIKSESSENKSTVSEQQSLKISDRKLAEKTQYPSPHDKEPDKGVTFGGANLSNELNAKEINEATKPNSSSKALTTSSFNNYEKCFINPIKTSKTKLCESKYVETEELHLQKLTNSSLIESANGSLNLNTCGDEVEKKLSVSLTKSPWRKKDSYLPKASPGSTVIDLTASVSEGCSRKLSTEVVETPSPQQPVLNCDSPDIIESSLVESDSIEIVSFKVPSVSTSRRRQSKTLVLKAGKLWRRSFSIYKRSSAVLNVLNEGACVTKDGRYCNCPKCKVSRESRCITSRRFSIKIVPATPLINSQGTSILENYAHNASYVSDQILEDNLENSIRSLSLSKRKTSIIQNSAPVTARELVLRRCGQTEPLPFGECYPGSVLQNCQKIGEGVYGEVFLFRNPNGGTSVMKVIPIEGDLIVNGERQKKFEEILSEIVIAMELSNLRNKNRNTTSGFSETQKIHCVQGCYPEKLLDLWDLYDETRGSENDSPEIFGEDQLYIVLQLANGGLDLEAFTFNNSLQAYTMFQQVACSLAVAEEELRFEHRDLHWGNILLSAVDKNKKLSFRLDGKIYEIMTKGVEVAIIDFTLSRIECDGVVIFNDLSLDPDIFTAEGDYQFEIYKLMQKKNGNNWERFEPYTNILWLHYTLDKAITALRYKNTQTKIHKEYISKLKLLKNDILNYNSVKEFVLNNF